MCVCLCVCAPACMCVYECVWTLSGIEAQCSSVPALNKGSLSGCWSGSTKGPKRFLLTDVAHAACSRCGDH